MAPSADMTPVLQASGLSRRFGGLLAVADPPDALFGDWVFEWYWKQPGVPHVEQFVADIRKRANGNVPTARTWFGYTAIHTCKLAAEKAKSLDSVALAKAMQGLELPRKWR